MPINIPNGENDNSWFSYFSSGLEKLNKPLDRTVSEMLTIDGDDHRLLSEVGRKLNVSLEAILQFTWHKLIHSYTTNRETLVGMGCIQKGSSTNEPELCVRPLYVTWNSTDSIKAVLESIETDITSLDGGGSSPSSNKQLSTEATFSCVLVVDNVSNSFVKGGKELPADYYFDYLISPLLIIASDNGSELEIKLSYVGSLEQAEAKRLLTQFGLIFNAVISNYNAPQHAISLLNASSKEYEMIVHEWNQTDVLFPMDKTLTELFQESVSKNPSNVALIFEGQRMTYQELSERANLLAYEIRAKHHEFFAEPLNPDTLIALYFDRGPEMVIGILAVLKAGGAYVPISPEYPNAYSRFILEDSGSALILCEHEYADEIRLLLNDSESTANIVVVNDEINPKDYSSNNLESMSRATDLAYVIYTSGTTGKPKGVMIEHRSVLNLLEHQKKELGLSKDEVIVWLASYVFDASVEQMWTALMTGNSLLIPRLEDILDPERIKQKIIESKVTHIDGTPSYLAALASIDVTNNIKRVISGGEVLRPELIELWGDKLINQYGPTEAAISSVQCADYTGETKATCIGKPISNTKVYVLDDFGNPVPYGVPGELNISGAGVARGYLNAEELTAEKIINNPFVTAEDQGYSTLYRTGDLVRWSPGGNLEFLGRFDSQVKIRGFRIELAEIESVLVKHPQVSEVTVLAKTFDKQSRDPELVAYCKVGSNKKTAEKEHSSNDFVQEWASLHEELYMVDQGNINTFDISGWDSSFSGEPIPDNEMTEWVDDTVERLLSLKPNNILEVGCGSGLLLYRLVSKCSSYIGFDFSNSVIERLHSSLLPLGISNARVMQGVADSIDQIEFDGADKFVDTIVINSVIQYFPTIEYLDSVIRQGISKLKCGRVFVGDVRDLRLFDTFHVAIQRYRYQEASEGDLDWEQIKASANVQANNEIELLIEPVYFIDLAKRYPEISYVEVLPKLGTASHEMNCYRYDVIIHVDRDEIQKLDTPQDSLSYIDYSPADADQLKSVLQSGPESVCLLGYPNLRVWNEFQTTQALLSITDFSDEKVPNRIGEGDVLSLQAIEKLAKQYGYQFYSHLSLNRVDSAGKIDLVFYRDLRFLTAYIKRYSLDISERAFSELANIPKHAGQQNIYNFEPMRTYLEAHLPQHMVPSFFVEIDRTPLTENGKVDHKSLLALGVGASLRYVAPRSKLEKQLCSLWQSVLGKIRVGVNDNFFSIGGNSIKAIRISAACRAELGMDIPLAVLFEHKTVSGLAANLIQNDLLVIPKSTITPKPLSFAQERLLFIDKFEKGVDAYHIPSLVRLTDNIDFHAMEKAINIVVDRHSVLKAVYLVDDQGRDYQNELNQSVKIQTKKMLDEPAFWNEVRADVSCRFDLQCELSVRFTRYQVEDTEYLLIVWHHIAFDGSSMEVFVNELGQAYESICRNSTDTLDELEISYADYAIWQREYLSGERLDSLIRYWREQLSEYETLALPTDKPRPSHIDYRGQDVLFDIDLELSQQLRTLAKAKEVSLYTVLISAFYTTLSALSGQNDIVVGAPSDNRHQSQTQSLIGFFVNTLVLRANVGPEQTVHSLLSQVHQVVTQAKVNQDFPFEQLVDLLVDERDLSRHPLFQVMFTVQSFAEFSDATESLPFEDIDLVREQSIYCPARFDLSVFIADGEERISGHFNYATSLYNEKTIKRMVSMYRRVLKAFVENQHQYIQDIDLLAPQERETVIDSWNQTGVETDCSISQTLPLLFESQVKKSPDVDALIYEGKKLTYRELNKKANQLACLIRSHYSDLSGKELMKGALIGLYLDRSLDMIISILAVMKAGGAYVPISPEYPSERTKFMLEDSNTLLLLSQSSHVKSLDSLLSASTSSALVIVVDDETQAVKYSDDNLVAVSAATDLAYVIYTSGTTGQPKGVMVEHRSVLNTISSMREVYKLTSNNRRSSCFSNYVFDVSVSEIFNSLCFGGELHLLSNGVRTSPEVLSNYISEHQLNYLFIPPAVLSALPKRKHDSLRAIIFAGEPCDSVSCSYWSQNYELYNYYGPTEASIYASGKRAVEPNLNEIGKPLNNTRLYVLNERLNPCPVNTPGELYISGVGLARGYLNQPELTQARFINNPFANVDDQTGDYARLYKTGDIVCWLPGGNLKFVGRNDNQIKILGYRIEIDEIERALSAQEYVDQALVIPQGGNNNPHLAAYIVSNNKVNIDQLVDCLGSVLPDYMIPSSFTLIDQVPLTVNGKLDISALPDPAINRQLKYVAPISEQEKVLCSIWQRVLGLSQVGINDNFFRIGGNSIAATRLTSESQKALGMDIPLSLLFEQKTISGISAKLNKARVPSITALGAEHYPLSFAQERLLFIERFEGGTNAYHIPELLELSSANVLENILMAFDVVINRHPVLKSVYLNDESGSLYTTVLDSKVSISEVTLDNKSELISAVKSSVAHVFDLSKEASIRLHCYTVGDKQYLLIVIHHIAFDAWSIPILWSELSVAYNAVCQQQTALQQSTDISYGDFSVWQRDHLRGDTFDVLLSFWKKQLSGYEILNLPIDFERPEMIDYRGRDVDFDIDENLATQLRLIASEHETTLYTVLLSGFYVALSALSGQNDVVVGTPFDNRHDAQTQPLIGFFANSLPLRINLNEECSISQLIEQTHQLVTQSKLRQELPFEKLVDAMGVDRDTSRHPLYQVMFTLTSLEQGDSVAPYSGLPFSRTDFKDTEGFYSPAKFDLSLFIDDESSHLSGTLNYAVSLFRHSSAERITKLYLRVLKSFADSQKKRLNEIEMVSTEERNTLLHTWNNTSNPSFDSDTLHRAFENQVKKSPNKTALVFNDQKVTYSELNQQANVLARLIRQEYFSKCGSQIKSGSYIALYLDRSIEMVVSILAVLKSGAAYVPISPQQPIARTQFILSETQCCLLLTQQSYVSLLANSIKGTELLLIDDEPLSVVAPDGSKNLNLPVTSKDIAYVIYTSGSTGQPKGVEMPHGASALRNHCMALTGETHNNVYLFKTNYVFDVSVSDLFSHLFVGAKIIMTQDSFNVDEINALLSEYQINSAHFVPSQFSLLQASSEQWRNLSTLYFSGENLDHATLSAIDFKRTRVLNYYGPTETGEVSSHIAHSEADKNIIGRPFDGVTLYVLSKHKNLVPIGTPGELYVGGAGLARGYFNQPELTNERFVKNPFAYDGTSSAHPKLIYKTGDLVRWLDNGTLEYLGRNDQQVKIRGHRVEIGEIESSLLQQSEILQAVVVPSMVAGVQSIAAYVVVSEQAGIDCLKAHLAECLPDYMIPSSYTVVDQVPLTVNGKVDFRALPKPEFHKKGGYVAPRNDKEAALCQVWESVLELERVGIYDNFFSIGGNSISAIKLTVESRRVLNMDLPLPVLFTYKNIANIAKQIGQKPMVIISNSDSKDSNPGADQNIIHF